MPDVLVWILAFGWIPTIYSLVRSWLRWWSIRMSDGAWLLLISAVVMTLVTPAVLYISSASLNRLFGNPPFTNAILYSALIVICLYLIGPVIETGHELWRRGRLPAPTPPPPPNGKGNGHGG